MLGNFFLNWCKFVARAIAMKVIYLTKTILSYFFFFSFVCVCILMSPHSVSQWFELHLRILSFFVVAVYYAIVCEINYHLLLGDQCFPLTFPN